MRVCARLEVLDTSVYLYRRNLEHKKSLHSRARTASSSIVVCFDYCCFQVVDARTEQDLLAQTKF